MGRSIFAALALLLAASAASAARPGWQAKANLEASMLVTGSIDVDAGGRVEGFEIDQADALPTYVSGLLGRTIPAWEFEPTLQDGKPVPIRTVMRVRIAARELSKEEIVLRVAGASFGESSRGGIGVEPGRNAPPTYPRRPLDMGVTGTVFLLGRVGADGVMQEVIAEQVNIRYVGPEHLMERLRRDFADASIRAAMKWTYPTPADVVASGDRHWSVRVPVDFMLGRGPVAYGEWDSYVSGPTQAAWWLEEEEATGPDTLVAGGIYPVGKGLKLLTPLDDNG